MAMLLGAASALLSAYFKIRNTPEPEIQIFIRFTPCLRQPFPTVESSGRETPLGPGSSRTTERNGSNGSPVIINPRLSEDEAIAPDQRCGAC